MLLYADVIKCYNRSSVSDLFSGNNNAAFSHDSSDLTVNPGKCKKQKISFPFVIFTEVSYCSL